MRKSRLSAGQISTALRQFESGARVAEVTRKLGVCEKTYYLWKKQHARLLTNELRQLPEENAKLKRGRSDAGQGDVTGSPRKEAVRPAQKRA